MTSVNWCGRRDLNPHDLRRWNLNPVRLPVPPRPLPAPKEHKKRASALAFPSYPLTRQIGKNSPSQSSKRAAPAKAREGDDLHISRRAPKATINRTITGVASPGTESGIANGNRLHNKGPKRARLGVVQGHDGTASNGRYQGAEEGVLEKQGHCKCSKNAKNRDRKKFKDHDGRPFEPALAGMLAQGSVGALQSFGHQRETHEGTW